MVFSKAEPANVLGFISVATGISGQDSKHWEIKPLDSLANFFHGMPLPAAQPGDADALPVLKGPQLRRGDSRGADKTPDDIEEFLEQQQRLN